MYILGYIWSQALPSKLLKSPQLSNTHRSLHTSLGLVGREAALLQELLTAEGKGVELLSVQASFLWGESSVTGVMGASKGAEPGGRVSGIPGNEGDWGTAKSQGLPKRQQRTFI